ncbi:MAG: DNA (cytosine-5-)-methyltransferase [bacterium]
MTTRNIGVDLERLPQLQLPPHPQAARTHRFKRWVEAQNRPVAVDLFCGAGGLSQGLEEAGYVVALSIDTDRSALKTHQHNLPGVALLKDLANPDHIDSVVRMLEGIEVDLIAGGPPCQPFSRAGRSKIRSLVDQGEREAIDRRAGLWRSFLEIVERVRPKAVLMENVPDMALGDDLLTIRLITDRLSKLGYYTETRLVDAWRYGVPQHRQRMILIAVPEDRRFEWPEEADVVTLREAIGDLPKLQDTGGREMPASRKTKLSAFQKKARAGMNGHKVVWDHITRPVRDDDREAFRLLKPGMRYDDLPERLRRYRSDIFKDKYNRLDWNDVSRSITAHIAKDGYWYIHPGEERTITVREAARIQTFPDHFRFAGSRSDAFRQIGNAVPPILGEVLGQQILTTLAEKPLTRSKRPSATLGAIREKLAAWGRKDARNAPWRHPGDPWPAVVGVLLADRYGADEKTVREFLDRFPKRRGQLDTAIREAAKEYPAPQRNSIRRLAAIAKVLGTRKNAWEEDNWAAAGKLNSTEQALVEMLGMGEPHLIPTTPSLRVVARLTDTNVDAENKLSVGKMTLAQFVGLDDDSPTVGAALHALGRFICTPNDPNCGACPVARFCPASRR